MAGYTKKFGKFTRRDVFMEENVVPVTVDLESIPRPPVLHGEMEINGIRLAIDPSAISVTEQNYNHTYQTLRTKESVKVRSGYARLSITVSAFFTGVDRLGIVENFGDRRYSSLSTINGTLMPILYSLKKFPLCFIENELIRRALPVSSFESNWKDPETGFNHKYLTGENIGAFLNSVNVSSVEGMPETLQAQFNFVWYNHRPFAHTLKFRKNWRDNQGYIDTFISEYRNMAIQANANGKTNATDDTKLNDEDLTNPEKPSSHSGRQDFLDGYGHPSSVFNATVKNNYTTNISHSRPFCEWMWPYKFESTNPVTLGSVQTHFKLKEVPFNLSAFDRSLGFEFTVFQAPEKVNIDGEELDIADVIKDFSVGGEVEEVLAPSTNLSKKGLTPKTAENLRDQAKRAAVKWKKEIQDAANETGVAPEVIAAVMAVESGGFNTVSDSSAGAQGLMQLVPSAQKQAGVIDVRDPAQNILGGAKLLKESINAAGGNVISGVWRYTRGPGNWRDEKAVLAKLGLSTDYPQYIDASRASELSGDAELKAFANLRGLLLNGTTTNKEGKKLHLGNSPLYIDKFQTAYAGITGAPFRLEGTPSLSKSVEIIDRTRARGVIDAYLEEFDEDTWHTDEQSIAAKKGKALVIRDTLDRMDAQNSRIERNFITGKVAEIKTVMLEVPQNDPFVIPISISLGFGNSIVTTPLEGHRFPTAQYIGGQNTVVNISLRCEGAEGRAFYSDLVGLQNAAENGAIAYREFSKKRPIAISNPLINSMNIYEVLIEDMTVDTIAGSPDGIFVNLRLVDATLNDEATPLLMRGTGEAALDKLQLKMFSLILEKGWIELESASGVLKSDPRLPALKTLKNTASITAAANTAIASIAGYQEYKFRESVPSDLAPQIRSYVRKLVDIINQTTEYNRVINDFEVSSLPNIQGLGGGAFGSNFNAVVAPISDPVGYGGMRLEGEKLFNPKAVVALVGSSITPGALSSIGVKASLAYTFDKLVGILGIAPEGSPPLDQDFHKLMVHLGSQLSFIPGHEAYPDLSLPPNPISGLPQDTTPDFFLYNESDIKYCKTPTLKILNGDIENTSKGQGLLKALYAIGSAHQGVQQVYGIIPKSELAPGEVSDATLGPDGSYVTANEGEYTTVSEKKTWRGKAVTRTERTPLGEQDWKTGYVSAPGLESGRSSSSLESRERNEGGRYKQAESRLFHSENRKNVPGITDGAFADSVNKISHVYQKSEYENIFTEFSDNYQGDHLTIRRSFPTFKVFFIDEEGEISANSETPFQAKSFRQQVALDDFYGVNSLKSIRIIEQKNMAASSCIIEVLDLDGILYNRKYLEEGSKFGLRESESRARRNPFTNTVIKEGMKVMVKLGYSNDPDQLETRFIGQIAQFEGNHLVEIICQSYGTELVAKRFGTDASDNARFWNSYTHEILHDCMDRDELRHFGRWRLEDINADALLPIYRSIESWHAVNKLRPDGQVKQVWSWKPSVIDDNIFAPDPDQYRDRWDKFFGNLNFVYWDTTIWDVFKECELRHPGHIAYPVIYGDTPVSSRMTMFFGNPSMEYLARPASNMTELEGEITGNNVASYDVRKAVVDLGGRHINRTRTAKTTQYSTDVVGGGGQSIVVDPSVSAANAASEEEKFIVGLEAVAQGDYGDSEDDDIDKLRLVQPQSRKILTAIQESDAINETGEINSQKFWKATMVFQKSRMKVFRNYELVTSLTDIVANNIKTDHRDTFNSIELRYSDGSIDFENFYSDGDSETMTINADDSIQEHHVRRGIESWINCTTGDLARRYSSQLLANSLKRTYKGELILLGKPHLKPYDILWIHDSYSDMAGPIEIDEVVHSFSAETGFVTEVVPAMIVSVKEEVTTLLVDAVGAFFTETIGDFTDGFTLGSSVVGVAGLGRTLALTRTRAIAAASKVRVKASLAKQAAVKVQEQNIKLAKLTLDRYQKAGLAPDQLVAVTERVAAAEAKLAVLKAEAAASILKTNAGRAADLARLNLTPVVGAAQIAGTTTAGLATYAGATIAPGVADIDDTGRGSFAAGVATGAGAAALFMWVPLIATAAAIGAGYAVFKFVKQGMTREPLIITPLLKQGKPYVTGIDGYESDGLVISDLFSMNQEIKDKAREKMIYKKWRYYYAGIEDASDIMQAGFAMNKARW